MFQALYVLNTRFQAKLFILTVNFNRMIRVVYVSTLKDARVAHNGATVHAHKLCVHFIVVLASFKAFRPSQYVTLDVSFEDSSGMSGIPAFRA
mmetsp:Transcript_22594/g.44002  ORF Transcript_22594/g.44002 Transcript_22594/m.44002 type:complete len:93 (-) Transcript_22594:415-693(-)